MFGVDVFNYGAIFPLNAESKRVQTFATDSTDLLDGYGLVSLTLEGIFNDSCGGEPDGAKSNNCSEGPFTQFNIRGKEGTEFDDNKWRFQSPNRLDLYNHEGGEHSGATHIIMRDGWIADFTIHIQTEGDSGADFYDEWLEIDTDTIGILDSGAGHTMADADGEKDAWLRVLLIGSEGDSLEVDIDQEWGGINNFFLKVNGETLVEENSDTVDDEVFIVLNGIYQEGSGGGGQPDCLTDTDCGEGEVCIDSVCSTLTPTDERCTSTGDCGENQICINGFCNTVTPAGGLNYLYLGIGGAVILLGFLAFKSR